MTHDIAPRLVTLPTGRKVGYRSFGDGPPVVLLHASPRSSLAVLPLGLRLAASFTVFAMDTPGFGWSDPLALSQPDAADFADALIEAFDEIGIVRAPVYGSHTGAIIAMAAAQRHPQRVPALALDGLSVFTPAEQAEYLANYLAPIRPGWDGAHLAFLWSRVCDQFTVFPWYLNGEAARLPRGRPALDMLQNVIVDFLAAGDDYRAGYAAAFRSDVAAELRGLTVPTKIMCRSDDLLFGHLERLSDLPDGVTVQPLAADDALWADAMRVALSAGPGALTHQPAGPPANGASVVTVRGGSLGLTSYAGPAASGRPLLVLPGIPGSARGESALARALAAFQPVVVVDLPGFGASSLAGDPDAAGIAEAIAEAVTPCGLTGADIIGMGESASIACALHERLRAGLVLVDPIPDSARASMIDNMTDIAPQRGGGHLLNAWHQLRDAGLWRPWFQSDPGHAIPNGTDPDVPRLQAILTDWMRGGMEGARTLSAALAVSLADIMPRSKAALVVVPKHPWSAGHLAWAAAGGVPAAEVGDDRHARAAAVLQLLARIS